MSKKQSFINYISPLFSEDKDIPEEAKEYWDAFIVEDSVNKPAFTENGKKVLQFLKEQDNDRKWKAKEIADLLFISSRSVAGSARKLVNDGYLEKVGQDPVFYILTTKGKEVEFND